MDKKDANIATNKRDLKKIGKIALAIIVGLILISALSGDPEPTADANVSVDGSQQSTKNKKSEKSPRERMKDSIDQLVSNGTAFKPGSYVKGDIPTGEYVYMPMGGIGSYYSEEDGAGNILDNENFNSFGYVYVHGAGNLTTDGVLIPVAALSQMEAESPREIYGILNGKENYKDSGYYKIGVDLPAGNYTVASYGSAYVAVMSGPVGKSEIIDNNNFDGKYAISAVDGQYLSVSRGYIAE